MNFALSAGERERRNPIMWFRALSEAQRRFSYAFHAIANATESAWPIKN